MLDSCLATAGPPSRILSASHLLLASMLSCFPAAAQPPVEVVADSGPYRVSLYGTALYAREAAHLEFVVVERDRLGADGKPSPVDGASIRCVITMPDMPGMAHFDEVAHSEGAPGVYGVHPDFPHGGDYKVTLSLSTPVPGSLFGRRSFDFELPLQVLEPDEARLQEGRVRTFMLELDAPVRPFSEGQPALLQLKVLRELAPEKNAQGAFERKFEAVTDFETRHERLVHLFVVRDDLGEFRHDHPTVAADGTARLELVFPTAGRYRLFAEVAPRGAGSQVVDTIVDVAGAAPRNVDLRAQPPLISGATTAAGQLEVRWTFDGGALPVRRTTFFSAALSDRDGPPVTNLQKYLGALGHLVLVHADGQTFVHAHPDDRDADTQRGRVPFVTWLPKAGLYRGWAQFQRDGRIIETSFVVRAE